jgi:hypothetical protein
MPIYELERKREHIGSIWLRVTYLTFPLATAQSLESRATAKLQKSRISYGLLIYFTKENLDLIWALDLKMNGKDFIKMKSYLASNLGC